uniref:Reverse transcriptase domain-containing protein n=1 Tax=Tanacetum cinerariifolium TaxID=118510 RepID=A0A6L2KFK5_TANCI|nr:reverse transcriptase domain-containing protein [Tanacetum cinerariifolium]
MAELLRAPAEAYAKAIMVPPIIAEHFELKHSLINMMTSDQFFGLKKDNPHDHIRWFNKITFTIKYKDVPNSAIKLMLFTFSFAGAAHRWLEKEPPHSILTWEDLVSKFINEFIPLLRTTNLRNEICNFQQRFYESFHEAWDCYKDLLRACPYHGFTELHQLDTLYNALNPADQDSLNSAAGGNLFERRTQDLLTIIENKSKQTSVVTTAMAAILKQFQATPPPAFVKAIEEICVTCGGAHPYYQCLTADGNTFLEFQHNIQGYVSAATVNYNQGNSSYRPPSELKAITTRSGLVLDGPFVCMPPPFINPKENERVKETLMDPELVEYTIKVPPPLVQKAKPPSQRNYVMLKALLSNKEKLLELANTPLNENCSTIILKKLPEKLRDPEKFLIPCGFSKLKWKALADLAGFENRPPMLNKENYVSWSSRLLRYAKSRPNGKLIHNSIINGPYVRRMILEPADDQAIQTILLGLLEDIYTAVDSCETAQEIWLRVQQMMKGSNIGIQEKKAKLFNEWERTQDPLALMATSKNPYTFLVLHQDQLSFNQNYMQQPMPNLKDITEPTTAINMALALIAKAFKLNYLTPTNNNQRISSNLCNRQISQQANLDEIEEVNAKYILMANLQQASTSGTQTDKAAVYDSNGSAETSQTELECTKERFENCIIKKETEYVKLWNDWYKKCDECKYDKISYDKAYKDMQQKIERLQAQLGDLNDKCKDTSCVSDTQNQLSQKLKNANMELEFQVFNYARENSHLKTTYKNLFDSISVSRVQTETKIASLQNELPSNIYKNSKLRTQLFKKVSDQKDNNQDTSKNTKFAKQPIAEILPKIGETNALSKPVTSNSVSTPQVSKGIHSDEWKSFQSQHQIALRIRIDNSNQKDSNYLIHSLPCCLLGDVLEIILLSCGKASVEGEIVSKAFKISSMRVATQGSQGGIKDNVLKIKIQDHRRANNESKEFPRTQGSKFKEGFI